MKFGKFTRRKFLEEVGRENLGRLFEPFLPELAARKLSVPGPEAADEVYFDALVRLVRLPDGLPDNLFEALFVIDGMANVQGHDRLLEVLRREKVELNFGPEASYGDVAVQVFLRCPQLLGELHNEQRLVRLARFEYFGSKSGKAETPCGGPLMAEGRAGVGSPYLGEGVGLDLSEGNLGALTAELDEWFARNNRGELTARVEVYPMEGEFWFLIRHGDGFKRETKLMRKSSEVLHFRPAKDDVVVYSPKRDEVRIHTRTKGERELYRRAFGRRLFRDEHYFCVKKSLTLEPLRRLGRDALDVSRIPGLVKVVLRLVEIVYDSEHGESVVWRADDLFAAAEDSPADRPSLKSGGRLVRAVFDFYFEGCKEPRKVEVKLENTLKFSCQQDARKVHDVLNENGFRCATEDQTLRSATDLTLQTARPCGQPPSNHAGGQSLETATVTL